jgi:hypothetical protein
MDEAMANLDVTIGIQVLEAWYKRINYIIQNGFTPDEFEMSIASSLMGLTKRNYKIRRELFNKLLKYPETSFLVSSLKWIIPYWPTLHITERDKIFTLINSRRVDVRWIKVILLTSDSPPPEIIHAIFGSKNPFHEDEKEILNIFPEQLL